MNNFSAVLALLLLCTYECTGQGWSGSWSAVSDGGNRWRMSGTRSGNVPSMFSAMFGEPSTPSDDTQKAISKLDQKMADINSESSDACVAIIVCQVGTGVSYGKLGDQINGFYGSGYNSPASLTKYYFAWRAGTESSDGDHCRQKLAACSLKDSDLQALAE